MIFLFVTQPAYYFDLDPIRQRSRALAPRSPRRHETPHCPQQLATDGQ
jgi:hypothetical protein